MTRIIFSAMYRPMQILTGLATPAHEWEYSQSVIRFQYWLLLGNNWHEAYTKADRLLLSLICNQVQGSSLQAAQAVILVLRKERYRDIVGSVFGNNLSLYDFLSSSNLRVMKRKSVDSIEIINQLNAYTESRIRLYKTSGPRHNDENVFLVYDKFASKKGFKKSNIVKYNMVRRELLPYYYSVRDNIDHILAVPQIKDALDVYTAISQKTQMWNTIFDSTVEIMKSLGQLDDAKSLQRQLKKGVITPVLPEALSLSELNELALIEGSRRS